MFPNVEISYTMKEDGKDKTWKDKTGRKYQAYGVEQRSEQKKSDELEEEVAEVKSEDSIPSIAKENEIAFEELLLTGVLYLIHQRKGERLLVA